jgi:hypothetical protein
MAMFLAFPDASTALARHPPGTARRRIRAISLHALP